MSQNQPTVDDMSVVILCGGQGTRIREASESLPKPLIDIGGKPILWHIMKIYGHYGFRRFVLALGYKGWDIKRFFLDYREHVSDLSVHLSGPPRDRFHNAVADEDWEITFVETGLHTATGARLRRVRHYVDGQHVHDDLRRRHRTGRPGRLARVPPRAWPDRHRHRGPPDAPGTARCT